MAERKVPVTVNLPKSVITDLLAKARESGKTISELINDVLPEVLAR